MSKRIPVYLSQEELRIILQSMYEPETELSKVVSRNPTVEKLQERLEAELATFEE